MERRLSYINLEGGEQSSLTLPLFCKLKNSVDEFRKTRFPKRQPHVVYTVRGLDIEASAAENALPQFTDEDEEALKTVRNSLDALLKKKEEATVKRRNYAEEIGSDSSDHEQDEESAYVPEQPHANDRHANFEGFPPFRPSPQHARQRRVRAPSEVNRRPNLNSTMTPNTNMYKGLPVHKWPIRFKGATDGSVISFLRDVDIRMSAEHMTEEMLFRRISFLLEGEAAEWYKVRGSDCPDWESLFKALKTDFIPRDFDYKIEKEIRATYQKESESFQSFWIRMEVLFKKLSYDIAESEKVEHLTHMMLMRYKSIETAKCKTVEELKEHCKYRDSIDNDSPKNPTIQVSQVKPRRICAIESPSVQEEIDHFSDEDEPKQESEVSPQELQAISRRLRMASFQSTSKSSSNPIARRESVKAGNCFNCDEPGHTHRQCEKDKTVFCYRCGKKTFYSWNCPDCVSRQQAPPGSENQARPQ